MTVRVALATALLCLLLAPAAPAADGDLSISAPNRPNPVAPGGTITYTVDVTNLGGVPATGVQVFDPVPAKASFLQGSPGCAVASGTIACPVGTLAAGATKRLEIVLRAGFNFTNIGKIQNTPQVSSAGPADPDGSNNGASTLTYVYAHSHDHQLAIQKSEQELDLEPGETKTVTLSCPAGDLVTDGSYRVDNVDQGTGTLRSPVVLESRASAPDAWTFTVTNTAAGRAIGKVFATCVKEDTTDAVSDGPGATNHHHQVVITGPVTGNAALAAGYGEQTLTCPADSVAVAPGMAFQGGARGDWVKSEPVGDTGWKLGFSMTVPGTVDVSIRCLSRYLSTELGHTNELAFTHPEDSPLLGPGEIGERQVSCWDEAKGIVASYDLGGGIFMLGHDPRPKTRAFKLWNTNPVATPVHLDLLCLNDRSGPDPPPPAAPNTVAAATRSSTAATVRVTVTCPAGGCSGTVTLRSARTLGSASFATRRAGRTTVSVPVARAQRAQLRRARTVTAVVRTLKGRTARTTRLTLRS
jgi:uncharacterized repeat protein (TIGR01451 family)